MDVSERNKAIELIKEMRGGGGCNDEGNGTRLTWMYKKPSELVDKEEYLLGKAIDKSFNIDKNNDNGDLIGRIYEASNVPKRLLAKPESTEQVDIEKKILEDPLYAIKQKELEARRRLLDNPVKLKELQKMIMERNLLKQRNKQKKKKLKKDATKDKKRLDKLILKKLKILSESQRKKLLEEAADMSDSSDSVKEKRKKKRLRSESSEESYSGNDSSYSSDDKKGKEIREPLKGSIRRSRRGSKTGKTNQRTALNKKQRKISRTREQKRKSSRHRSSSSLSSSSFSSSSSDSSSSGNSSYDSSKSDKKRKSKKIKIINQTHPGKSNCKSKRVEKSLSPKPAKVDRIRKQKKHYSKSGSSSSDSEDGRSKRNIRQKFNHKVNDRSRETNFRQRQMSRSRPCKNDRQKSPPSSVHTKELSEKEREATLKEMMENAKVRKIEREQNLANHRKIQTEEEKLKDYDDGFIRRQISQATSKGTMADRIRSNVNNIQRSKADMDRSFVRK